MATCATTLPMRVSQPHAAPASRASWCGQLRLGDLDVPVKAYAAIATPPETPLRQLHSKCGRRIEYRKTCPTHGEVPPEEVVKGYPYQADQYVRIPAKELDRLQPPDDKTIQLQHFLDPSSADLALFAGRSLVILPANPAATVPFAFVHQAIHQSGKWGIGQVVFSSKRHLVVIHPEDSVLMLHTIHHPAQRRALPSMEGNDYRVPAKDLRRLLRLIESTGEPISWDDYRDETDQRLVDLVQAKLRPVRGRSAAGANGKPRSTTTLARSGATRTRRKAA